MSNEIKPQKKLPIGIQTFADIRNGEYYYVDKTRHILELVEYRYIFLSRPRRFGKSLTLDTIDNLFSGNKELFTNLYATSDEANWDWETIYPVIRFTFAKGVIQSDAYLYTSLNNQIEQNAKRLGIDLACIAPSEYVGERFNQLIDCIVEKYNQKVVILIDEYDKPILDNLNNSDIALQMRDELRSFYSVIKGQDANIRFAMLTGVSKFSKVNLFSGLNNLYDITLNAKFSNLCGYTQNELTDVFADELTGVNMDKLRHWYNGYNWTGEAVYNPFDILLFLADSQKNYQPYWFETGTPTFLIDKMVSEGVASYRLDGELANEGLLSAFDVGDISPIALMFQTGYLTIHSRQPSFDGMEYLLGYPNLEVKQSLNRLLLARYVNIDNHDLRQIRSQLYDGLLQNDFDVIEHVMHAFFASIPHDWHRRNNIAHCSLLKSGGYWASVFYAYFASLGLDITVEDSTSKGRMDMVIDFNEHIYIFEFKVIEQAGKPINPRREANLNTALEQIKSKGYAEKYAEQGKPIYLIGVEFSETEREMVEFEVEFV